VGFFPCLKIFKLFLSLTVIRASQLAARSLDIVPFGCAPNCAMSSTAYTIDPLLLSNQGSSPSSGMFLSSRSGTPARTTTLFVGIDFGTT
jgi:hypothetical protein